MPCKGRGRTPPRYARINIRAGHQFNDWLLDFAKAEGCSVSNLVEQALRRHATLRKRPQPPIRLATGE